MASKTPREIRTVLSTLLWEEEHLSQLRAAFEPAEFVQIHPRESEAVAEVLERADVALLPLDLDERFLNAPRLKWIHCDHAGLTRSARPEVFEKGLIVTGSAGRSAEALAQHAFYFALGLTFDARGLFAKQDAHDWSGLPGYHDRLALWGKTLGVIGYGNTGQAMGKLGAAFGMRVLAYRRSVGETPAEVERMLSADAGDSVDDLVAEADVIMIAANLSDETYHLLGPDQFSRMKPGAFVINLARGQIIDQDALIAALRAGAIGGAGLDVTDPEPLPADSPLWDLPNVMITPHKTPALPERTQRSADVIIENVGRFRRGEPLRNALDPRDVYSRPLPPPHYARRASKEIS